MTHHQEPQESAYFDLRYGSVTLAAKKPITFEGVTHLAAAAQVIGVPASAAITRIQLERRTYGEGPSYEVRIDWQAE